MDEGAEVPVGRVSIDLRGRVALVTGASSGIGEATARALAEAGAKVVLGARRRQRLDALARDIGQAGGEALAVALDVAEEASIVAAFDAAEAAFGTVDTVIANAGIGSRGRATDVSAAEIDRVMAVNFRGVFLSVREGAKRMIAQGSAQTGRGRVVIVSSVTAVSVDQSVSAYAASKAAVLHLGRSFAREWIRLGVNVNVVLPGYIRTELNETLFESAGGEKLLQSFPRGRLLTEQDLTPVILYLASDAARGMTGASIVVDDGQML